jgi:hypothetical protein
MAAVDPAEDKLNPFRQQAAMLGRKKESAAEALGSLKKDAAALKSKLEVIYAIFSFHTSKVLGQLSIESNSMVNF